MSKKVKIIIAISGGCIVGGLGVCATIWPEQAIIFASASGLVAMIAASVTGIAVTK
jgi:hypothetical protein